jgi:hypothetical protein
MARAAELRWWTHTRRVGWGMSADTDDIAETVTPARPAGPAVVTTLTVQAARLMPFRKRSRISRLRSIKRVTLGKMPALRA